MGRDPCLADSEHSASAIKMTDKWDADGFEPKKAKDSIVKNLIFFFGVFEQPTSRNKRMYVARTLV